MPTISDVARRAGVSTVTVSRVINAARHVNPATRERVEQAIQELGYVPNLAARSLRSKRTCSLALVLPDITNIFWTTVARGVEDAAHSRDYSVLLCNTDENPAKQMRYLEVVASQRVDGVIIAPYNSEAQNLAELRRRNVPTVVIDRHVHGWDVDTVTSDSVASGRALVRQLISQGHRRIAVISGPPGTSTADDRVAGYCLALVEAGIPVDPRLIKAGEFRATAGERLTAELFDEGLEPGAIFAANNAIALGVITSLERRGLRAPQDVAIVCIDDLPNADRCFPFLTVVVQPAYDMGVNAAQLLLSRLKNESTLPARHVVLPTRMIVRGANGRRGSSEDSPAILVKPLTSDERHRLAGVGTTSMPAAYGSAGAGRANRDYERSDVNRLLRVFQHGEADRLPHLELRVTSRAVYEYVLERELKFDMGAARAGGQSIAPEDQVEFAQRLGMDAVGCSFSWRPGHTLARASGGAEDLAPPAPLAEQLGHLERFLRAAQGTGVGVFAAFTSFFASALLAAGATDARTILGEERPFVSRLMDIVLEHQARVVQTVCDRFAGDLAFVLIDDDIAGGAGLLIPPEPFCDLFVPRMRQLIAPAQDHGKPLAMHTGGKMDQALPILYSLGFNAVHPVEPEHNDIGALKQQWAGKLAFVGNLPAALLASGAPEEIEAQVRERCRTLAPGGGYVLGSSGGIVDGIPAANFVAMTRAAHKYGRYGALGQVA